MSSLNRCVFKFSVVIFILFLIYFALYGDFLNKYKRNNYDRIFNKYFFSTVNQTNSTVVRNKTYNVWCIFSRINKNIPLKSKFRTFVTSLIRLSTVPLYLHILSDNSSKIVAQNVLAYVTKVQNKTLPYKFYDIKESAEMINDIVDTMMPHFSSQPGTYYSDALFYLSLGLHRIAPKNQNEAIMLDCDVKLIKDVALLFKELDRFEPTALFGLAPELTPVYRHILYTYRLKHKNSTFGEYYKKTPPILPKVDRSQYHRNGYPGYNSGVILFNFERIRKSKLYSWLIKKENVSALTRKYYFKGHLGDQDFYTLLGYEYPELIHTMSCGFNRQLCLWWRDHGYRDVFDKYFKCWENIVLYHGNCNSIIPS